MIRNRWKSGYTKNIDQEFNSEYFVLFIFFFF